jgi:hypothetical protein
VKSPSTILEVCKLSGPAPTECLFPSSTASRGTHKDHSHPRLGMLPLLFFLQQAVNLQELVPHSPLSIFVVFVSSVPLSCAHNTTNSLHTFCSHQVAGQLPNFYNLIHRTTLTSSSCSNQSAPKFHPSLDCINCPVQNGLRSIIVFSPHIVWR